MFGAETWQILVQTCKKATLFLWEIVDKTSWQISGCKGYFRAVFQGFLIYEGPQSLLLGLEKLRV